jgi:hypothetical protein
LSFKTNLNQSPYFDDYDFTKDFYRVLFRPGFSVQTRELNQLQTILQKQVELFGDNIITKGSIVDGCNFAFHTPYRFVKIRDTEINGQPVVPLNWVGFFAESEASGLIGTIVNAAEGFETADETNTLYIKYINSGTNLDQSVFLPNQILRIRTPSRGINEIDVVNGGVGFSNSDSVVVTPAMVVSMSVGTITEGAYIQTNGGANVQVVSVDSTTLASEGKLIIRVVPRDDDLAEAEPDATNWTISKDDEITNVGATIAGTVDEIIGEGLHAIIRTSATGVITNIIISDSGRNYSHLPTIRVISEGNSVGLTALELEPLNYVARVRVINRVDAVGSGYAFSVSEGVTYFRGAFLRVAPQTIIVSRYTTTPDDIAVGFSATEEIITSDIDTTLLDNAQGEPNETAPGADRLKVSPVLELRTVSDAAGDDNFFPLVEWSEGIPYKQNQLTSYSKIGDHIAETVFDQSGDFVLDPFEITTRSPANTELEGQYFSVVVDPGVAFIQGKKVNTQGNYVLDLNKGTDTRTDANRRISLNYGNYIRVNSVAGNFLFNTGKKIRFYSAAKNYYASSDLTGSTLTNPTGTVIGTARVRCFIHESGTPGTSAAVYRAYLFDININSGQSFSSARSIWGIDAPNGVADIVTETDATTGGQTAVIYEPQKNELLFYTGSESPKSINSINYTYRTVNSTAFAFAANGTATFDRSAVSDEAFPFAGSLTDAQMQSLYIVPQEDMVANSPLTGTTAAEADSTAIIGSGTAFLSQLRAGDYVSIGANSTGGFITRRVVSVTNNTHLVIHANSTFTNATAVSHRMFPNNVPIPFGSRAGLSANVSVASTILYVHLDTVLDQVGTANAAIAVDVERNDVAHSSKTIRRNHYVKLNLSTHPDGINGPWCLGVPDIFRLRGVWVGGSGVTESDQNITGDYFIDHNQNPNMLNLGFLYKQNSAKRPLTTSDYLLVKFDYFVRDTTGVFDILSYVHNDNADDIFENDSLALSALDSDANYFEVPDVLAARNKRYDLKKFFDFRPAVTNTATTSSSIGSAPSNPSYTVSLPDVDFKFPSPNSILECEIESWQGRLDNILISKDGRVYAMKGQKGKLPKVHAGSMLLNTIEIPPYPGVPVHPSTQLLEILNTRVGNEKISRFAIDNHILKPTLSNDYISTTHQPKQYSMREIGALERKIQALEYYVALTVLESSIADRSIPSSIDPSINRFKFGFFVDDFNNTLYGDIENDQFSVEYIDGRIYPHKLNLPVIGYDQSISFPYENHEIIRQVHATETGTQPNCVPNTNYAVVTTFRREANTLQIGNAASSYIDNLTDLVFANVSSPAVLYFSVGASATKIEVYQNNVLIRTSNDAVNLSNSDINTLKSNNIPGNFFTSANLNIAVSKIGNNYVRNAGKISWTHDPTGGRSYRIVTYKGDGGRDWRYMFEYPIDASSVGCIIETPTVNTTPNPNTPPPPPTTPPIYEGTMTISPNTITRYDITHIVYLNGE